MVPRNPYNEIHAIAAETLGVETIAPDENLFELGFDSLTICALAVAIKERHGTGIPLRAFFDCQTLAGLAATMAGQ